MDVIKSEQLTESADSSSDSDALAKGLHSRIARERVQMKEEKAPKRTDATAKRHVLHRDVVEKQVESFNVPVPELEADFPLSEPLSRDMPSGSGEETEEPEAPRSPEEIEAEWEERLNEAVEEAREEGFEAGRKEGYDDGYAEARAELEADVEAHKEQLNETVEQLETLWNDFIEESQQHLVKTTIDIAETLVDAPLPESVRRVSARAIAEAVEDLAGTPPLTINLHPVDYQHLQETGMFEQIDANHDQLRWNTRPELEHGDWSVESPVAMVRHFREELARTLKTRLGALHDSGSDSSSTSPASSD